MKKSILILTSIIFLLVTLFSACQSSEAKQQNAEEKGQKNNKEYANSKKELSHVSQDTVHDYQLNKKDSE